MKIDLTQSSQQVRMRIVFFTVLFLLVSMVIIPVLNESNAYQRKVLAEIFTNSYCPLCPRYIPPVEERLREFAEDEYIQIQYHTWWPGNSDPWYMDNYERCLPDRDDVMQRMDWMGFDQFMGVPSFFFDGFRIEYGGEYLDETTDYIGDRLDAESPLEIQLQAETDGENIDLRVRLSSDENLVNVRLFLALCEKEVEYDAPSGQTEFIGNVLSLFPTADGRNLSLFANSPMSFEFRTPINVGWHENDPNDLFIAGWIQDPELEVIQAQKAYIEIGEGIITSEDLAPTGLSLNDVYPNPFNNTAQVGFQLQKPSHVNLKIISYDGKNCQTLANGHLDAGSHSLSFNADNLPSGPYLIVLRSQGQTLLKKALLIR